MDADGLELTCPCGYEHFERIVVQRRPHPPIVTDFVACVGCKTMYWAPRRQSSLPEPSSARPSIGPPLAEASSPGLKTWGGVPPVYREHEQSPEELEDIKKAAARANKRKPKR
jgi:hypothetical protein